MCLHNAACSMEFKKLGMDNGFRIVKMDGKSTQSVRLGPFNAGFSSQRGLGQIS